MGKILFYGDSITANFKQLTKYEIIENHGIGGDKTLELIGRSKMLAALKPDKLFMMIGINDFLCNHGAWAHGPKIPFYDTYETLLKIIKANMLDKKVYLISILPIIAPSSIDVNTYEANAEIDSINQFIQIMAEKYGFDFLNIAHNFKDLNNQLHPMYTEDGIHLNELGYTLYESLVSPYFGHNE